MNTFFEETPENIQKTLAVLGAQSWMELKSVINSNAPFISMASGTAYEWSAEKLLFRIEQVRSGHFPNMITRSCGLRAKVCELVLCKNYGDPWE